MAQRSIEPMMTKALRRHLDQQTSPPESLRKLSVREIYLFARSQYVVRGSLAGRVVLFRVTQSSGDPADLPVIECHSDPMLGWEPRIAGVIQAIDVPGGHVSMLQEPHVETLARKLQEQIDRASATTRREGDPRRVGSGRGLNTIRAWMWSAPVVLIAPSIEQLGPFV
jgi:thioesterase domain-containing protein